MKSFKITIIVFAVLGCISSCKKDNSNSLNTNPDEVDNSYHFSFKTPDYEKYVPCDHVDLFGNQWGDSTRRISFSSASTNADFTFTYPSDSSFIVSKKLLKKFPIRNADYYSSIFCLSLTVPETPGSAESIYNIGGFDDNNYCQITEIKFLENDGIYSKFSIKGKYKLEAKSSTNTDNTPKLITGTFHWKVNAARKLKK